MTVWLWEIHRGPKIHSSYHQKFFAPASAEWHAVTPVSFHTVAVWHDNLIPIFLQIFAIFREIVDILFSFCFHILNSTLWILRNFSLTSFWQKFRESNVFTTDSVWKKYNKTRSRKKKNREINSFINNTLIWWKNVDIPIKSVIVILTTFPLWKKLCTKDYRLDFTKKLFGEGEFMFFLYIHAFAYSM